MSEHEENLTEEEVVEILRRAVNLDSSVPQALRERMNATAAELGISQDALRRAEEEVRGSRTPKPELEVHLDWLHFRQLQSRVWVAHAFVWLAILGYSIFSFFYLSNVSPASGTRPADVLGFIAGTLAYGLFWGILAYRSFRDNDPRTNRSYILWKARRDAKRVRRQTP